MEILTLKNLELPIILGLFCNCRMAQLLFAIVAE